MAAGALREPRSGPNRRRHVQRAPRPPHPAAGRGFAPACRPLAIPGRAAGCAIFLSDPGPLRGQCGAICREERNVLKLIIGNKAYSSWSLRGWLAVKQSGLPFEEITVPLFNEEWDKSRQGGEFAPSGGKVPILWDDKTVIWDSLAIIAWLAHKTDPARY